MKIIVGLGNPGNIYKDSRHNIGFLVVKALAKLYKIKLKNSKDTFSLNAKIKIKDEDVILAMPLTFMNLSGVAVSALIKKHKIDLENLLVVYDDLDLEFGRLKLKGSGSSAGHHGLGSIIDSLGTQDFGRLRIGIAKPSEKTDTVNYVLSSFTKREKEQLKEIIEEARHCCQSWILEGFTKTMNNFNQMKTRLTE